MKRGDLEREVEDWLRKGVYFVLLVDCVVSGLGRKLDFLGKIY